MKLDIVNNDKELVHQLCGIIFSLSNKLVHSNVLIL